MRRGRLRQMGLTIRSALAAQAGTSQLSMGLIMYWFVVLRKTHDCCGDQVLLSQLSGCRIVIASLRG